MGGGEQGDIAGTPGSIFFGCVKITYIRVLAMPFWIFWRSGLGSTTYICHSERDFGNTQTRRKASCKTFHLAMKCQVRLDSWSVGQWGFLYRKWKNLCKCWTRAVSHPFSMKANAGRKKSISSKLHYIWWCGALWYFLCFQVSLCYITKHFSYFKYLDFT